MSEIKLSTLKSRFLSFDSEKADDETGLGVVIINDANKESISINLRPYSYNISMYDGSNEQNDHVVLEPNDWSPNVVLEPGERVNIVDPYQTGLQLIALAVSGDS